MGKSTHAWQDPSLPPRERAEKLVAARPVPVLRDGVAVGTAIQAHDVIAMARHYVVNDQEHERFRASIEVDEHVLREPYLLPFEMLVKDAQIAAIMSAYNRVRGVYATECRYALTDVLRTEWGFDGDL